MNFPILNISYNLLNASKNASWCYMVLLNERGIVSKTIWDNGLKNHFFVDSNGVVHKLIRKNKVPPNTIWTRMFYKFSNSFVFLFEENLYKLKLDEVKLLFYDHLKELDEHVNGSKEQADNDWSLTFKESIKEADDFESLINVVHFFMDPPLV